MVHGGMHPMSAASYPEGEAFVAEGGVAESISPIVEAMEELTDEQKQVKESLTQLGESISDYATHLKSHTSAVQSLARVAELLEGNIQRQTELMERSAGQEPARPELSHRPKSVYLRTGPLFDQT